MNWKYKDILELMRKGKRHQLFVNSLHGLERECLRVDSKGQLSQKPHPKSIGAALTHPYITTDFCESQLELISPPLKKEESASNFLKALHCFINDKNPQELIWPLSMPCHLPSIKKIPFAQYGESKTGQEKTQYRIGLAERYGHKMQTVSGTHYNLSFSEEFWQTLYKKFARKNEPLQQFISESYLHITRNFLRYSWLNTYLFGASPAIDKSYLKSKPRSLKRMGWNTYYGPYTTSLRMSNIGYYSKVQSQLTISYNSLDQYIENLRHAISTPSPAYKNIHGLNDHILQIENEHYSRIRPKQVLKKGESALEALSNRGILYIELRALDINPYQPIGIAKHQLRFLQTFVLYCLFNKSPKIDEKERQILTENQNTVALYGRKPGLMLHTKKGQKPMQTMIRKILQQMEEIAEIMDQNFRGERYISTLKKQQAKVENPELTPSARILREMKENNESFQEFGLRLANEHKQTLDACEETDKKKQMLEDLVDQSYIDQQNLEIIENSQLSNHEDLEISTQMLIREAQKRKIKVDILDRKENFLRLSKGRKVEYVKQATYTSKDSQISYHIMENKVVSKLVLQEKDIPVPQGDSFTNLESALAAYPEYQSKKIVVKPTFTNFGIGISFIEPKQTQEYQEAVKKAFEYGDSIIVEEFITGDEYRILVVDYKAVAIVQRIPANVLGDGEHSIAELIAIKNADARNFKFFKKYQIQMGQVEQAYLKQQKLTFKSIPKKNQKIFLRQNSNVSTGGDSIDFTNKVAKSYKKIAEQAARAAQAKLCGVDMMITNIKKSAELKNHSIIEINFNPSLHIHGFPVQGEVINVAAPVLDLLGF